MRIQDWSYKRLSQFLLPLTIIFLYNFTRPLQPKVTIPDTSFEKTLIFLGVDSDMVVNGLVNESDVKQLKHLDLSHRDIYDLKGIEKFTSLEQLDVSNNNLERLDLSNLKSLKELDCSSNSIKYLDIRKSSSFKKLKYNNNSGIQVNWY